MNLNYQLGHETVETSSTSLIALDENTIDQTSGGIDVTIVTIGLGVVGVGIAGYNAGYRSGADRANRDNNNGGGGGGGGK